MTTQSLFQNSPQAQQNIGTWQKVCQQEDLVTNSGVSVLVEGQQVAIFSICDIHKSAEILVYACDNYDPIGKANVLSRGILSSIGGEMTICSPLYKHHYSLIDGHCLEQSNISLKVYPVKIEEATVSLLFPLVQGK